MSQPTTKQGSQQETYEAVRRAIYSILEELFGTVLAVLTALTGLSMFSYSDGMRIGGIEVSTLIGIFFIGLALTLFVLVWDLDKRI